MQKSFPDTLLPIVQLIFLLLNLDMVQATLGENHIFPERGSLCFQLDQSGDCIPLTKAGYGWFKGDRI